MSACCCGAMLLSGASGMFVAADTVPADFLVAVAL